MVILVYKTSVHQCPYINLPLLFLVAKKLLVRMYNSGISE